VEQRFGLWGNGLPPLYGAIRLSRAVGPVSIGSMFRERLEQEFAARRKKNPRHSLRAFAAFLGTDHSTLSQILRGRRPAPAGQIRRWGKKLGLSAEEAAVYIAAQHVPDAATAQRQQQLRHWTAEAIGIVTDGAHWEIVRLSRADGFQLDCRWIAEQAGLTVDQVNLALARLLRLGLLEIGTDGTWKDLTRGAAPTERQFRKLALARVREKSKE
jgi:transcriptional regulator with XRE-family HTH domain